MITTLLSLTAIICYLSGGALSIRYSRQTQQVTNKYPGLFALTLAALACHGIALHSIALGNGGINLGIFNAASLVALCISLCLALILPWKPMLSLGAVVFPLTAIFVALTQWMPNSGQFTQDIPLIIQLHIALSIFAYSLFAIASLQAIYLATAHHRLKTHRPILHFLPPLPAMESTLFQLTGIAFVLLTGSLILGGVAINNIGEQHLAHKIVFSILAWIVFATLIVGRLRFRWRGHRAVKYVCAGFILLALAFFGTKLVLELILQRA